MIKKGEKSKTNQFVEFECYDNEGNFVGYFVSEEWLDEYAKAIDDFNMSITLNPDQPVVYTMMGDSYSSLRDYERAIQNYSMAIQLDPNNEWTYTSRGMAYFFMNRDDYAINDLNYVLRLNPNNYAAYVNLGLVYKGQGLNDLAIENFQKALALATDPQSIQYIKQNLTELGVSP